MYKVYYEIYRPNGLSTGCIDFLSYKAAEKFITYFEGIDSNRKVIFIDDTGLTNEN